MICDGILSVRIFSTIVLLQRTIVNMHISYVVFCIVAWRMDPSKNPEVEFAYGAGYLNNVFHLYIVCVCIC